MKYFNKEAEYDKDKLKKDVAHLGAGFAAGAGTAAVLNPLDIYLKKKQNVAGVKDKIKLQEAKKELSAYVKDLKSPNIGKAWFHGYGPKALKVGAAGALQFMLYNKIRDYLDAKNKN